jgi:prevent-host-death family protein
MAVVTANDLKTRGISEIERLLREAQEVIISVRGKPSYVVMDIAHYDHLRECEIGAAWSQAREDVADGRYRRESAEAHLARVKGELTDAL